MKKKGISPLIATVLLIGFTVVIAVSIWMWYGNIVKEQFMKQGALSEIESDCLSEIELQIISATSTSVDIKNNGNKVFNGVRIIVNGDTTQVLSEKETFKSGEQKTLEFVTNVVSPDNIEVMPMIVRQGVPGTCSEKGVKFTLL